MASVPAAQAVQAAVTGPRRPSSIETWPAPMFATLSGIAKRRDAVGAALEHHRVLLLARVGARAAVADDRADALAVAVDRQPRVGDRQARRGDRELGVAVHAPRDLAGP